jgi:hypothetical protein
MRTKPFGRTRYRKRRQKAGASSLGGLVRFTGRLAKELVRRVPRLHLVRFRGCAPELKPAEGVWKLAKGMPRQ